MCVIQNNQVAIAILLSPNTVKIVDIYNRYQFLETIGDIVENVNSDGCQKIIEYAEDIAENPKYQLFRGEVGISEEAGEK